MGTSWSKNGGGWFNGNSPGGSNKEGKAQQHGSNGQQQQRHAAQRIDPKRLASQFVYTRRGSMFFDEDGDLAHEFYEEVKVPGTTHTTAMRRKLVNLRPQGMVYYPNPRLHVDFPIAMYSPIDSK